MKKRHAFSERPILTVCVCILVLVAITLFIAKPIRPVTSPAIPAPASELAQMQQALQQRLPAQDIKSAQLSGFAHATGQIFLDPKTAGWYFYATALPQPAPGSSYELWLMTGQQTLATAKITPDSTGAAMAMGAAPVPTTDIEALLTLESTPTTHPSPDLRLSGELH